MNGTTGLDTWSSLFYLVHGPVTALVKWLSSGLDLYEVGGEHASDAVEHPRPPVIVHLEAGQGSGAQASLDKEV